MNVSDEIELLDGRLAAEGSPESAANERRYLRSELRHHGTSVPAIGRIAKAYLKERPALGRQDLLALSRGLWAAGVHEQRMLAADLLVLRVGLLRPDDLPLLEALLRSARTWALVDTLAIQVVGPLLRAHPEAASVLDRWAGDEDFWLRRTVLLSHLLPMRKGEDGVFGAFARHADPMLEEREFFIRKAIGWVLRERGSKRPEEVEAFLRPRLDRVAGLTFREAVKHLPEAMAEGLREARG